MVGWAGPRLNRADCWGRTCQVMRWDFTLETDGWDSPVMGKIMKNAAEGWYRDPYEVHRDRWFSAGVATKLVRDGGGESYDPPPGRPLPEGELIPAAAGAGAGGTDDQRRADDGRLEQPYTPYDAGVAVGDTCGTLVGGAFLHGLLRDRTEDH